MKVKELIEQLKNLNPESEVTIYCEDEGLKTEEDSVQVFEVIEVSETEAESDRLPTGKPWLKFGKSQSSSKFSLVQVTSDV